MTFQDTFGEQMHLMGQILVLLKIEAQIKSDREDLESKLVALKESIKELGDERE